MKVAILLRFPKIQNANWKRKIIDELIKDGHEVHLVFGESSLWRHLKFALKTSGFSFINAKSKIELGNYPKLIKYFNKKVDIYKTQDLNSVKSEKIIRRIAPDILLLLGTGIIRKNILEIPRMETIHCHQGHLPSMRGVNTIQWSILLDREVYITIHVVDPGIDTGDILSSRKIEYNKDDCIESIYQKCEQVAVDLIPKVLRHKEKKEIRRIKQQIEEGNQYFSMHPFFIDIVEKKIKLKAI